MIVIASVPALVALAGALVYALSANGKVSEMGRIAFAFGLLVLLMTVAHVHL
jgi:hypothetical protein